MGKGRWLWWGLAMLPFCYVLFQLLIGLGAATQTQPEAARGLIGQARLLTAVSWLTYPGVYIVKMMGISGPLQLQQSRLVTPWLMWSPRPSSVCSSGPLRCQERCHGERGHHGLSFDVSWTLHIF